MVEKLFYEMDELKLPIQESIIISVINCCRSSVRPPKHIYSEDDALDGSKNEWAKALWIVNRWAGRVEDLTESLYTIAMDVCLEAGRVREVVKVYQSMLMTYKGPIKSSLSFAFRACERLKDADVVVQLLYSAIERRMHTNAMIGSVITFCESVGRLDAALEAYEVSYVKDMKSSRRSVPPTNTRRIVRSLLGALQNDTTSVNTTLNHLYTGLHRIIMATLKGGELVLEYDDYYTYIRLLLDLEDILQLRAFLKRTARSPLSHQLLTMHSYAIETMFNQYSSVTFGQYVLDLASDMQNAYKSRSANHLILSGMSLLYNNDSSTGISRGYASGTRKESIIFSLFERGRDLNVADKTTIPLRMYRIAALACRDGDMDREMLKLYLISKEDGVVDRAVLSQCVYVLSKSRVYWERGLEVFELLRQLPEKPDTYMYTSALVACENGRDWKKALVLLDEMQRDGHPLNTFAVTTCIAACAACGESSPSITFAPSLMLYRGD